MNVLNCESMPNNQLAGYLTTEFSSIFTPSSMAQASSLGGIKLFLCDTTGLPLFEVGEHGGPLSKLGMPKIGGCSILIKVNPISPLAKILPISASDDIDINPSNITNEAYQRELIIQVYNQILGQLNEIMPKVVNNTTLSMAIRANNDTIQNLLDFIGCENDATKTNH